MAKKFFYVCGGLLMLAVTVHVSSGRIEAQGGGSLEWAQLGECGLVSAGGGRTVYSNQGVPNPYPVPGSARVVGGGLGGRVGCVSNAYWAVLETGEIYRSDIVGVGSGAAQPWVLEGNMFGVPTSAPNSTWGQVKARYR